jgi:phenylpyruvate tautomerase PptA (4-oxalocrotonate tautomerase family)
MVSIDAFTVEARVRVAAALTDLGIACERLSDTAKVRAGVWVFFTEHASDAIFSGGQIAPSALIRLVVYALEGGLDGASKRRLIADATTILGEQAGAGGNQVPVYVVIRDVPEVDWGMYGKQVSLAALRAHVLGLASFYTRQAWYSATFSIRVQHIKVRSFAKKLESSMDTHMISLIRGE